MPKQRSYNLLCPIARALDALGDRWSLLILRDLHAGPARFADLQAGLTGIASNLLADRLTHLTVEGMIKKAPGPHGTSLYQLTEAGLCTRDLLFALARISGSLSPVPEPKKPGNLRTIAVTLAAALDRVITPDTQTQAQLLVDGEAFTITISHGSASVTSGVLADAPITLETTYNALLRAAAGAISIEEFATQHATASAINPSDVNAFLVLMESAMAQMQ